MKEALVKIDGGVCAAQGFTAAGMYAGFRLNPNKKDLALVVSKVPCVTAAVYTQNKVFGAPITVNREHLVDGISQACIINSGNANTCNADGVEKANAMCALCAEALGLPESSIIVASTGVIGKRFDLSPVQNHLGELVKALSVNGAHEAAQAIMTTDTVAKEVAYSFDVNGTEVHIGGMAKGSGMIMPNMATMLCFITTDAAISRAQLDGALKAVIKDTFNMVSVDGDTSTNDMVVLQANGCAGNPIIDCEDGAYGQFYNALYAVCEELCRIIAKDGEGATKLVQCEVSGAIDNANAKIIARSIINSSLVKTAMFGADANWGRVLCAIGYAPADVDVSRVAVYLSSPVGEILVCEHGAGVDFSEEKAKQILLQNEITIRVILGDGDGRAKAWGCDLSYEYVRINGDYRT